MMRLRNALFLFLILGIALLNLLYNLPKQINVDEKIADIESSITTIRSIDIDEDDFSDLAFLDTIIGNKQIVFLGEQLHHDGSTFQAKSRLIRYLHEKHEFNIVLYEAGLYDMWFMNNEARKQTNDTAKFDPTIGLYSFWGNNEYCKPIWQYYNKTLQSDNPITLGGFDVQLTSANRNRKDRAKSIIDFLSEKQIDIENFPSFNSVLESLDNKKYLWEYKYFTQTKFDSIQIDLTNILDLIPNPITEKDNIHYRYLKGIRDYGQLMWDYDAGEIPRMNARDSLMAENLIWQIDSLYKDQKIIVWSANLHLFKTTLEQGPYTFIPMGKFIKEKYPNSYMMAFTSYALTKPDYQYIYDEAGVNSLEYLLHSQKYKYAYFDINSIDGDSYLKGEFTSIINQRANGSYQWSNLIDGLFYIDVISTVKKQY